MARVHTVTEGECLETIAVRYGFAPDALWGHDLNRPLRESRRDGHVLAPGDEVVIPDVIAKSVACATGKRHRFRLVGVPSSVHVVLQSGGKPRAGVAYVLTAGEKKIEGTTDDAGNVHEWLPVGATTARLVISENEQYELRLGHLDPVDDDDAAVTRLVHLGHLPADAEDDEDLVSFAVSEFQAAHELEATGELDDATRNLLAELHGS